jgi:hypothetical protein
VWLQFHPRSKVTSRGCFLTSSRQQELTSKIKNIKNNKKTNKQVWVKLKQINALAIKTVIRMILDVGAVDFPYSGPAIRWQLAVPYVATVLFV